MRMSRRVSVFVLFALQDAMRCVVLVLISPTPFEARILNLLCVWTQLPQPNPKYTLHLHVLLRQSPAFALRTNIPLLTLS